MVSEWHLRMHLICMKMVGNTLSNSHRFPDGLRVDIQGDLRVSMRENYVDVFIECVDQQVFMTRVSWVIVIHLIFMVRGRSNGPTLKGWLAAMREVKRKGSHFILSYSSGYFLHKSIISQMHINNLLIKCSNRSWRHYEKEWWRSGRRRRWWGRQ